MINYLGKTAKQISITGLGAVNLVLNPRVEEEGYGVIRAFDPKTGERSSARGRRRDAGEAQPRIMMRPGGVHDGWSKVRCSCWGACAVATSVIRCASRMNSADGPGQKRRHNSAIVPQTARFMSSRQQVFHGSLGRSAKTVIMPRTYWVT